MKDPGEITCNGEAFQQWCADDRYEILSFETPRPNVYRFTPRLKSLPQAQCSTGETQSRPYPARAGKVMESAGHIKQESVAGSGEQSRKSENASAESSQGQTNDATALDLEEPLFGNISQQNPSDVVITQELPPIPHVPAGPISHRIELLPSEVADFMLRSTRLEIVITGQAPHTDGRHTIFEYQEIKELPPMVVKPESPQEQPLVMNCQYCQGPLEPDGTCKICDIGERILTKSRANRKEYHEAKKAGH